MGQHHPRFCWAAFRDGMRPLRFSMVAGLAFAVALVVGAAGCGGSSDSSARKAKSTTARVPTTEPALPPTTTRDQLKAQILEDYRGYWETYLRLNNPPLAASDQVDRVAVEVARDYLTRTIQDGAVQHTVIRERPASRYQHDSSVVFLGESVATVQDCVHDDLQVISSLDGHVINDRVNTKLLEATMKRSDGRWKLATYRTLKQVDGISSC